MKSHHSKSFSRYLREVKIRYKRESAKRSFVMLTNIAICRSSIQQDCSPTNNSHTKGTKMDEKLFHAHKDTRNPNNPYPEFVRQAAKRTKVPIELLTRKKYRGKSANGKGDNHHILDKSLFPKERHANYQRFKRQTLRTSMLACPSYNPTRLLGLRTSRESRMLRNPTPHRPNLLATHRIPPDPVAD